MSRGGSNNNNDNKPRGGAASRIREECERFFCETMKTVFQGERNTASTGSCLTGVRTNGSINVNGTRNGIHSPNGQLCTPPNDYTHLAMDCMQTNYPDCTDGYVNITAWLEVWDYAGGAGFRGFVTESQDGDKTMFVFFDKDVLKHELKKGLMALIELAEAALECDQLILCIDRGVSPNQRTSLLKGLQWAGFSATTLDTWTGGKGVDVTSRDWIYVGMEL